MPLSISNSTSGAPSAPPLSEESSSAVISSTPSAPSAPELEGVVQVQNQDAFEWNTSRLFRREEGGSWTVTILSSVFVIPVVLTMILDLFRLLAFSVGLANGKSWSLSEKLSEAGRGVEQKATAVWDSIFHPQPKTLEEENLESKQRIFSLTEQLTKAYCNLNGGYLGNSSFSSSSSVQAEMDIRRIQTDIQREAAAFVDRNAKSADEFVSRLQDVNQMVAAGIYTSAGDMPYIEDKVRRTGPRQMLRDVMMAEFNKVSGSMIAGQFVALARKEDKEHFASKIASGVQIGLLTPDQAKSVLVQEIFGAYKEGLKKGLQQADSVSDRLIGSAVQTNVLTEEEAAAVSASIRPTVEMLADAAAKDMVKKETLGMSEAELTQKISQTADLLKGRGRLSEQDESRFLIATKEKALKIKAGLVDETARAQKEAAEIAAKQAEQMQKAADQASLLNRFLDLLGLMGQKQEKLGAQFSQLEALEQKRQTVTDKLESIRNTNVTVGKKEMTILNAAQKYYELVTEISNDSELTAQQKQDRIRDLVNQGFSQQTIQKIEELRSLEPILTQVIDEMANLSSQIAAAYEELSKLTAVYKMYRKNNLNGLESANRKVVVELEKKVGETQKTLTEQYREMAHDTGFISRLKSKSQVVVNSDPEGNRAEVEAIVQAFRASKAAPKAPAGLPKPRKIVRKQPQVVNASQNVQPTAPQKKEAASRLGGIFSRVSSLWSGSKPAELPAVPAA